jgi:uridine phosphorylase
MRDSVFFSQAVRSAGKRFQDNDSAEGVVADFHVFTGGLALGMEAEMIFGMGRMRYARTCKVVFAGAYRIRPTAMDAKNHCSGQPDGAAAGER